MTISAEPPSAQSPQRFPDFYIVGHSKSGTTALYEMLRRHPQIYMPDLKEPTFFATDLRPRLQQRVPEPETLADYLALFAHAGAEQRVGEASSLYLFSQDAAEAIAAAAPAARIVAILREPASFLRSLHLQLLQIHNETENDLRAAIALEPARRRGERIPASCSRPQALLYSERVRYVEQLRRFDAVFAPEQILTLVYDDFRDDNDATVRQVLRFLDVDDAQPLQTLQANPTVAVRSLRLHGLKHTLRTSDGAVARAARAAGEAPTGRRVRAILQRSVYGRTPPADEQLMLELRRRFAGEVVALSDYLGHDLVSLWGYDSLG
jgi:hypothetical protein